MNASQDALIGYVQRFPVRFDECARDGAARASTLFRYVVETAFAHSTAKGFPLAWYDTRGLHWVVRRARIDLHSTVPYGALLDVATRVVAFRRIWAQRRNTIQDIAGRFVAEVVLDWIFTDRDGNPTRIVPEMAAAFPDLAERVEIGRLDLGAPPANVHPEEFLVPAHQTDPRGHMNSAAYLDLFEDALVGLDVDPQARPARYDLEFLRAVVPGEVLLRSVWAELNGWAMIGSTSAGVAVVKGRRTALNAGERIRTRQGDRAGEGV